MSTAATECVARPPEQRIPSSSSQPLAARDRFYGHRVYSECAERYIMSLFACPHDSVAATQEAAQNTSKDVPRLAYFIAYALYRTRLPVVVSYHALIILKRLKERYPAARGSSGHRLFIAAYMLASKMVCDDSYNNKSWTIVCQGLLSLREVNQMERELLGYLALNINATAEQLTDFATEFELFGAPRISLAELCDLRILPSRAHQPTATVGDYKRMSTPAYSYGSSPMRMSRSAPHRRCTSMRPDFWTQNAPIHTAAIDSGAAARARRMAMRSCSQPRFMYTPIPMHTTHVPFTDVSYDQLRTPPSKPLYLTSSNSSSVSITTPGSLSNSTRVTPTTSMSDVCSSPWGDMRILEAGLPQFSTPQHESFKYNAQAADAQRLFSPAAAAYPTRAVFCTE